MSKRRNKSNPIYWQAGQLNQAYYQMYREMIMTLAMNRYRWVGLPESCDPRYLEMILCTQGVATIAKEPNLETWVSTMCTTGPLNIYDDPTSWESVGNNGWSLKCDITSGTLVWDNKIRFPIFSRINLWARRLAEFDRTIDINLKQQRVPYIFTAPQERKNDLINIVGNAFEGEPAILGYKGIDTIKADVLVTPTEYRGEELSTGKERAWSEVFLGLGIEHLDRKSERMVEAEVDANHDPTNLIALDGLMTRRQACRNLEQLGLEGVYVYWNHDNATDNYNVLHNIQDAATALHKSSTTRKDR